MRDTIQSIRSGSKNLTILALGLSTAFLAGMLAGRPGDAEAQQSTNGQGGNTATGNQRMIAATGSVGSGMSVLWLIDTEQNRLLVYGTNSLGKTVELRAARNIRWDTRLDEYHDESQYKSDDLARLADKRRPEPTTPAPTAPDAPK